VIDKPENLPEFMVETYSRVGRHIYGYLLLKSQNKYKTRTKSRVSLDENNNKVPDTPQEVGTLLRKALKSKKVISPRNNRLIPIWDEETWNIIKRNKSIASQKCIDKVHGPHANRGDYFLFDDIEAYKLRNDFRLVCTKGYHATRHSYITLTIGDLLKMNKIKYPDQLIRSITGITSAVLENYIHIYEEMMLSVVGIEDLESEVKFK
jgi:hypothetical protein